MAIIIITTKNKYMNENKKLLLVGIVCLVGGLAIGSVADMKEGKMGYEKRGKDFGEMHMMGDGKMMHGSMDGMAGHGGDRGMQNMMDDMSQNLQGKIGAEFDKVFLTDMIVHHKGAVVMAELALKNAESQNVKDLSRAIIDAQNKEIADMEKWLSENK
jgi:uncharacterized protein (DUF305 family)